MVLIMSVVSLCSQAVVARRLSRAESQARTRRALIDAAGFLFGKRGYDATSVDEIAARAAVTRGAVYANFAGKEDLLVAVVERAGAVMEDMADTYFADPRLEFPVRLRLYARHLLQDWRRVRETILLYSELEVQAMRNPKLRARMAAAYAGMYDRRGPIIEQGASAHGVALPLSGAQTLQLVGATVRGLLQERIVRPEPVDEQFLGDALLLLFGYTPGDHPLP